MSEQHEENPKTENAHHLFSFLGILLVLVGQILVYTTPIQEGVVLPPYIWLDIAGVILFIWSQIYRPGKRVSALLERVGLHFSRTAAWVVISIVLSLLTVLTTTLFTTYARTNFIPVLTFWGFAIACYLAAFLKNLPSRAECLEWLKLHRYELAAIGLVTLLGAILRFYQLGDIPRVVNGDEGRVGLTAISTNSFPYANPFSLWENFGGLYLQAINYFLSLLGVSPFSLRLLPAIGGTLAIPAIYLLARQITGHRIALIAACLLAISHTHIHFSRTVAVAYIQGTWLIPLELYFWLSGLTRRSSWRAAVGGVLLAIHFSIYLDSQIIAGMLLVYTLISFLFLRSWLRPALGQVAVFWAGFGIILLPELVYILQQPVAFFDRLNKDGMFQSGWLMQEMARTGHNAAQILGERVIHAFLSIIYYPSFDFYGSTIPMLSLISAMLFLLGLGVVLWKTRSPGHLLLNGYFWAGTFAVGMFSIPPSADTYRMLIVLPAALLMAAIGLDHALHALGVGWTHARSIYVPATATVLFSLLVFNVWTYYFHFAGHCLYGSDDAPTRFASYLGNYAHTFDRDTEIYLLSDEIYFYGTHQSVDFLSNKHAIVNVGDPADTLQVRPGEVIIASPNRIVELRDWADNHPGGALHYEYDCQQVILLGYSFP